MGNNLKKKGGNLFERVAVLESNLDDVSGEVVGFAAEKLMKEGALDVVTIPTLAKKERPGFLIKVIAKPRDAERLAGVLMFETGSLGVRVALVDRYILERKSVPVEVNIYGKKFRPHVKIAEGRKKAVVVKAEYEDAKRISEETKLPFREVVRLIEESWRKKHHL